jgi:beta-glucosidase
VKEGKISEKRINQSVKKILRLKASLGLFDNPYPAENSTREEDRRDHLNMAQIAAEGSMVLLKNEGILPLDKSISRIAVTGFAVNSRSCMNGGWTFDWAGAPEDRQPEDMLTIPEALKQDFPLSHIYEVALSQENNPETDRLIKNADVIILTAGEMPYSEFRGNINDLTLDKIQDDWIRKIFSFNKPVILVLIEGRPRLITDYVNQAEAIIFAGLPGMKGAEALSGILCGRINPSGHLSFSYPLSPGHAVPYYQKYTDASTDLFPFGHGLSYTSFIYSDLHVTDTVIHSPTDTLIATIKISNCGNREGQDVILWFLSYPPGKFTRPQKILRQFNKVSLKSGETTEVSFKIIPAVHFSYPDETGKIILQKGDYHLTCADQSVAIHYLK